MINLPDERFPLPKGVVVVGGIDTDIGKSYATGAIYAGHLKAGHSIITHKMVQTGSVEISEDIQLHRQMAGVGLLKEDENRESCPYLFKKPASPDFAAALEGVEIQPELILDSIRRLAEKYERVLVECAGGLMVPLNSNCTIIDLISALGAPLVLVTSGRLGSINHTLLSLEAIEKRGIELCGLVYNRYGTEDDQIGERTLSYLCNVMKEKFPLARVAQLARM